MYKIGMESLIKPQLNDPIISDLEDFGERLRKLGDLYYIRGVITGEEFSKNFIDIQDEFREVLHKRFNINIKLRSANTFAIMPIFNTDKTDMAIFNFNKEVKNIKSQITKFKRFIQKQHIEIDLEKARIEKLPEDFYFPLFIDLRLMQDITNREFAAIILHEIGHVFTLLEMYTKTTKTIVSLEDTFIKSTSDEEIFKKLKIGNVKDKVDGLVKIYEKLEEEIAVFKLVDSKKGDDTDTEYEADNFVVKFGLASELVSALNKLSQIINLSFYMFPVFLLLTIIAEYIGFIIVMILIPQNLTIYALILTIMVIKLIVKSIELISLQKTRNPNDNEHGDIYTRYTKVKLSLIEILRVYNLTKEEQKMILTQYENVVNELEKLKHTFASSFLGGFIDPYFNANLNIRENLALTIEKLINNEMYIKSQQFKFSLESLSYQTKDPIVEELIDFYTEITDNSIFKNIMEFTKYHERLSNIIYERFGIPVLILPASLMGTGFACLPFNYIEDSALSDLRSKAIYPHPASILAYIKNRNLYKEIKNGLKITIDKDNLKINGLPKSYKSILFIEYGRDMFGLTHKHSTFAFTPEELTAFTLHEIGHLFTFIQNSVRFVATNTLLQEQLLDISGSNKEVVLDSEALRDRKDEKIESSSIVSVLYGMYKAALGIMNSNIYLMFLGSPISKALSAKGYDRSLGDIHTYKTDAEDIADDFAVKFGMGKYLASGLKRFIVYDTGLPISSIIMFFTQISLLVTALNIKSLLTGKIENPGSVLINLILKTFKLNIMLYGMFSIGRFILGEYFPYKKLPDRLNNIKRSLISVLRSNKVDKEEIKKIVNDIEEIDKIKKEVENNGYGSIIMGMFVPDPNNGVEFKPSARLVELLDNLINNDLYVKEYKFSLENYLPEPNVYMIEFQSSFEYMMDLIKTNENKLKDINEVLFTKGYELILEGDRSNGSLKNEYITFMKSTKPIFIRSGATGITILPLDKKQPCTTLTLDYIKVGWLLENPYIKVYDIRIIKLDKYKYIYIVDMEQLDKLPDKKFNVVFDISSIREDIWSDYGHVAISDEIKYLKKYLKDNKVKLPKELEEQIDLLGRYINKIIKNGVNPLTIHLDIHTGNYGYIRNKIVLFDPVYSLDFQANKKTNYMELDLKKLNKLED